MAWALVEFPSPRGVELHKPTPAYRGITQKIRPSFRPLAGLSCINLLWLLCVGATFCVRFPSPRGVELHKPEKQCGHEPRTMTWRFRPLAGLSCINRTKSKVASRKANDNVSVPSRG